MERNEVNAFALRPLTRNPQAGPLGRCTRHPARGIQDLLRRNKRAVQWGVPAKEAAWPPTLQARVHTGVNLGHPCPPWKNTSNRREDAAMPEGDQEWGPHYREEILGRRPWDDDSCDHCKLAKAREAHWWALAAAHLLKERIDKAEPIGNKDEAGWPPTLP